MKEECVYFVAEWDKTTISRIIEAVKNDLDSQASQDIKITLIGAAIDQVAGIRVQTMSSHLMGFYRRNTGHKGERTTLLSPNDQLLALQLCQDEANNKTVGKCDVEINDVVAEKIVSYKLLMKKEEEGAGSSSVPTEVMRYNEFLSSCNHLDLCDILTFFQVKKNSPKGAELFTKNWACSFTVILDLPTSLVEKEMMRNVWKNCSIVCVQPTAASEDPTSIQLTYNRTTLESLFKKMEEKTTETQATVSVTEAYAYQVLLSFLELLVNSRSQIALARAFCVYNQGQNQKVFTDLKRSARLNGLPMYQMVVSFVMKIRLGSKGHSSDSRLAEHVKKLAGFVDLMQKLQTIIEEDLNVRSACQRVLDVVKKTILSSHGSKLRSSSIEDATDKLHGSALHVISELESEAADSPNKVASEGGSLRGRQMLRVFRRMLDAVATRPACCIDPLSDVFSSQHTPVKFTSLLTHFRSPVEASPPPKVHRRQTGGVTTNSVTFQETMCNQSHLDWVDASALSHRPVKLEQGYVVIKPSKTLKHPASSSKNNRAMSDSYSCNKENRGSKQRAITDFHQKTKQNACQTKVKQKSCRRKLLPQVKGQQSLMMFFKS